MAAVLFVVMIPTEEEEKRRKSEFVARQSHAPDDANCPLPPDDSYSATVSATTVDIPVTPTPTPTPTPNATPILNGDCYHGNYNLRRKSVQLSEEVPLQMDDAETEVDDGPRRTWEGFREILTSSKRKTQKRRRLCQSVKLPADACMEEVLREILKKFKIHNAAWTKDCDNRMHQIIFTMEFNETYENLLDTFHEWGIGDRERSMVSVMNVLWSKTHQQQEAEKSNEAFSMENLNDQKQGVWDRFMNSVRSRLNVAQIVREVSQDAAITFDFMVLLISASILASFGLVEDSTIFLASSMLISPLMGPIIAGIFGTVIKDRTLRTIGLKNELIGILVATLVGFLFGLVVGSTDERYGNGEGLTKEMLSRCDLHSLLVGVFTAIPSGAAAAIGILGGNIGSLVGVAISASLLPPAVNSGLLWAVACMYKFFEKDESRFPYVVKTNLYSNNQATELAILGSISMCLTIANVLCIYVLGILVLKVKEIAPVISQSNQYFWKHDIKIARDLKKADLNRDAVIINEFANLPKEDQKALGINCELLRTMQLDDAAYQNTWSPVSNRHHLDVAYEPLRDNYSTVHHIDLLYHTITQQQSSRRNSLPRRPIGRANPSGTHLKILHESIPRSATMPSNSRQNDDTSRATDSTPSVSQQTSGTSLPKVYFNESNRHKFVVTPAVDPLDNCSLEPDEVDV